MKVNPVYMYEDLKNVNIDLIPPGFKTPFRGDKIQKCGDMACIARNVINVSDIIVSSDQDVDMIDTFERICCNQR